MDGEELPGAKDGDLNPPQVTPVPAPPDDQLFRLAALGSVAGAVVGVGLLWWLRRNISISWRKK